MRSSNQGYSTFDKKCAYKKKTAATYNALGAASGEPPLEGIIR